MDLSRFPRRRYSQGPSPIEFLPNFTKALGGPRVWIKRDDMLGLAPGGNKTRKLEFLMGDALAKGADTLVTCGAPQSNHCRITLAAAVKEGLKCRFVIEERVPGSYKFDATGNQFMFRLLGVEAVTVVPGGSNMAEAMEKSPKRCVPAAASLTSFQVVAQTPLVVWATLPAPKSFSSNCCRWGSRWITLSWVRVVRAHTAVWWLVFLATTFKSRWSVSVSAATRQIKIP